MRRRAVCCCGQCSVETEGEPTLSGLCNCNNCRARTGSAFGWNNYFPDAKLLSKEGDFVEYRLSQPCEQSRYFCRHCGTTLLWTSAFMPGHTGVAGGCFRSPELPGPKTSFADAQRLDWVQIPPDWLRK